MTFASLIITVFTNETKIYRCECQFSVEINFYLIWNLKKNSYLTLPFLDDCAKISIPNMINTRWQLCPFT